MKGFPTKTLKLYHNREHIYSHNIFIADWLSRQNHKENEDTGIPGMQLNSDTIQKLQTYQIA